MRSLALFVGLALAAAAPAADLVPPEAVARFDVFPDRALPALAATTHTWDVPFELAPEMTLRYEAALRLVSIGQLQSATRLLDEQRRTRQVRQDPRFWFLEGELLRPRGLRGSLQNAYVRAAQLAPDALYQVIRTRLAALGLPQPPARLPADEAPTVPPEEIRRQFEALARALACGDRRAGGFHRAGPPGDSPWLVRGRGRLGSALRGDRGGRPSRQGPGSRPAQLRAGGTSPALVLPGRGARGSPGLVRRHPAALRLHRGVPRGAPEGAAHPGPRRPLPGLAAAESGLRADPRGS